MSTLAPSFGHSPRPSSQDRRAAIRLHESAHSIAALAVGFTDVFVTMDTDTRDYSEYNGPAAHMTAPKAWSRERRSVCELTTCYAGQMAETMQYGRSVLGGASQDARDAQKALAALPAERRARVEDEVITRTREILENRWADVEFLAELLEQHPILGVEYVDGELVVSIVRDTPTPGERAAARQGRLQNLALANQ